MINNFDFDIVNFPFLDGDVPKYFSTYSISFYFFNTRKVLTAKLLRQGYRYHKLRKAFSKFYRRHFDIGGTKHTGIIPFSRLGC